MTMLGQANPYFVRCIKPNVEKLPDRFLPQVVLNQLKYSGKTSVAYVACVRVLGSFGPLASSTYTVHSVQVASTSGL